MPLKIAGWDESKRPGLNFVPERVASPPGVLTARQGSSQAGTWPASHLRGWREPLHWQVPPAFENPGQALIDMGLESYKSACESYYREIRDFKVGNAQRLHSRWVLKRVMREFETHVRHFRRSRWDGSIIGPEKLWRDGRLLVDLEYILRRYQVAETLREPTKRLIRRTLAHLWQLDESKGAL